MVSNDRAGSIPARGTIIVKLKLKIMKTYKINIIIECNEKANVWIKENKDFDLHKIINRTFPNLLKNIDIKYGTDSTIKTFDVIEV